MWWSCSCGTHRTLVFWIALPLTLVYPVYSNNRVCTEVVSLLQQFPDLDKMLSGLTHQPKTVTQKTAHNGIDTLIYMKQALHTAPLLAAALQKLSGTEADAAAQPLVGAINENLSDPTLKSMEDAINAVLTESTTFSKSMHEMRHQECFALRTGLHGLLDVARKTFLQTVEDLYKVST
jgi:DNA mismatch repair protein MSH4